MKINKSLCLVHACMLSCFSHVWICVTLWTVAHKAPLCPWDSPGRNTGVGCHALLQGSNPFSYIGRWVLYHWSHLHAAAAKSLQSCPTLCDPIDGSPPGSPVPGILQTRTLEWVAISFSNAWKWKVKVKSLSHIQLLATPWTAAY